MPLVTEQVATNETMFLLPILLDADEGEERIRAALLDPSCTAYASWLDGRIAGAAVVRWEEDETSEILYIAVAADLRGRGYGKQICKLYRKNCLGAEGMYSWLGRRTPHLRTLLSTRNAASACLKSGVTILLIFSRRYLSMGLCCAICWFCVMNWNEYCKFTSSIWSLFVPANSFEQLPQFLLAISELVKK
jgi:GNAT superfamily N-acetyltransferase